MSFSQKLERKVEIDGEIYNGWHLYFKRSFKTNYSKTIELNYKTYAGVVFGGEKFELRQFELSSLSHYYGISPLIQIKQVSNFEIKNGSAKNSGSNFTVSPGIKLQRAFKVGNEVELNAVIGLSLFGHNDYFSSLNTWFHYKNNIRFLLQTTYYNSSSNLASKGNNYQYYQLLMGLKYIY